ncbi:GNAT family N-acetyltransferase [Tsukamurella sputi]|uniref:GNAT family N-acetyltransferase n=1 Tax=Tsukamurella sputi TaxID=2591848 RepID=A0A5C5RQ49_9ACTN|nr:GNAT family N-acetyltransferase [Tsukamurella sputi]TWS25147.1 GNAT family N-acetyltransferase [Tsukamurella sputi]
MNQSNDGRYRIGEHVVEIRAPRLSDADSWRRTNLEYEGRLRPAFGSPERDWDADHSCAAWAATWWTATHDPDVRIARVLTLEDGARDRVVGYQAWAGRDPRTGHAEASTWVAGLPRSYEVTAFFTASCVADAFRTNPDLPYVVAPMAVHNRPPIALAESVGFTYLQTLRRLREYDGTPTDHSVHILANTEKSRDGLETVLASIGAEPVPSRAATRPTLGATLGLARHGVRRLRTRARAARLPAESDDILGLAGARSGDGIRFQPTSRGGYTVAVGGRAVGETGMHVDSGTSTTEIIDRLRGDTSADEATAVLVAACRAAAERQDTRRLTIALADRHAAAHDALIALGFASEGPTLPTIGDEGSPRESWTRLREE